jgi:hypothetical protein
MYGALPSTDSTLLVAQGPVILNSSNVACTQIGGLLRQTPLVGREGKLLNRHDSPRTLLDSNLGDPFDSSPVSMTHRMHELIHHCMLTPQSWISVPADRSPNRYLPDGH